MHKTRLATWVEASLHAASVLLFPVDTPVAQTTMPAPETRLVDTRDHRGPTRVWGWRGVIGLLGLAGRRRRPEPVRTSIDLCDRSPS